MEKVICPECNQRVEKAICVGCGTNAWEDSGDDILCLDIRGKHACQEDCYLDWLKERFEETHTVSGSYTETLEK